MSDHLGAALREELQHLLSPLTVASGVEGGISLLLVSLGQAAELGADPGLQSELNRLGGLAGEIGRLEPDALDSWEGISRVLVLFRELMDGVRALQESVSDPALRARVGALGLALGDQLVSLHLRTRRPRLFKTATALTLITPAERSTSPEGDGGSENGAGNGTVAPRDVFHPERVASLLRDAPGTLASTYLPGELQQAGDAHLAAHRVAPALAGLAGSFGLSWFSETLRLFQEREVDPDASLEDFGDSPFPFEDPGEEDPDEPPPPPDVSVFHREHLPRFGAFLPGTETLPGARVAVALGPTSAEHPLGVPGLLVTPAVESGWSDTRGGWRLELDAAGSIPAFVLGRGGLTLPPLETPLAGGSASFRAEKLGTNGTPAFRLGPSSGTRLEIGDFRIGLDLLVSPARRALEVALDAESGVLILAPGAGDGFLGSLLPPEGARVAFDLGLLLSSDRGLEFRGGAGLDLPLAPALRLGPLSIPTARLALEAEDNGVRLKATSSLLVQLGPAVLTVEGLGLSLGTTWPEGNGSLGSLDLAAEFQGPTGAGLSIDAPLVGGGGFLVHDSARGRYMGALHLKMEALLLSALGILDTRLPGGGGGFSLLAMITAEDFAPIDLGLGFRLTGIGGIVGFHRGVAVDVLQAGLQDGTLDSFLFPRDPVRNAAAILQTAGRVFPSVRDQHVVGPVAEIQWGTGGMVTARLGLVVEFPAPLRIVLVGQVRARFPSPAKALIRLNLAVVGVVDLDRGEAVVRASLFDSRLLGWAVSGDAAVHARWKEAPEFILSAGGFHPAFPAPAQLPPLERLSMVLSEGDAVRLTMRWYLALTANTLQHGAHVQLRVQALGFSVDGHLGYDTLIQIDPFGFSLDFTVNVGLKWHGHTLAAVRLNGALSGPSPWHIRGRARFDIAIFSKSISFDRTIGTGEVLPPAPVVDPLPELLAALSDLSNWESALPEGAASVVTFRSSATGEVLVHPLGGVGVRQQVLPLDLPLTRFGNARFGTPRSYGIVEVVPGEGGIRPVTAPLDEHFAAGQFLDLTQADRLERPSFERMQAGVQVAGGGLRYGGQDSPDHRSSTALGYETLLLPGDDGDSISGLRAEAYTPDVVSLDRQVTLGSPADVSGWHVPGEMGGSTRRIASVRSGDAAAYVLAGRDDLVVFSRSGAGFPDGTGPAAWSTFSAAQASLIHLAGQDPAAAARLQVVPIHTLPGGVTP